MSKGEFLLALLLVAALVGGYFIKEFTPTLAFFSPIKIDLDDEHRAIQENKRAGDPVATAAVEVGAVSSPAAHDAAGTAAAGAETPVPGTAASESEAQQVAGVVPMDPLHPYPDPYQLGLPPRPEERLNLNTATVEDLMRVPGIGKVMAERIIDYRSLTGGIRSAAELMRLDGMGGERVKTLEEYFTYGSAPDSAGAIRTEPIRDWSGLNTADPYVAPTMAPWGVAYTPPAGMFEAVGPTPFGAQPLNRVAVPTPVRSDLYAPQPVLQQPSPTRPYHRVNSRLD